MLFCILCNVLKLNFQVAGSTCKLFEVTLGRARERKEEDRQVEKWEGQSNYTNHKKQGDG